MSQVTFSIIGMGNRGRAYAGHEMVFPDQMKVVAIADNRKNQLTSAVRSFHLSPEYQFDSAEELLKQPKLSDILIIATQDRQHREHAIRALRKGYDLLLEKPIASSLSDCIEIANEAEKLGRRVIVCHVLRYTPFYSKIKEFLDEGRVGKTESLQMIERVGYYHIAHSFVRGNWHSLSDSSPLILAKCCHDMDLMVWLTGKQCERITSFGSLDLFKKENCPDGATARCTDGCPYQKTCPYDAESFYLSRIPGWPTHVLNPDPTPENIMEALKTTDYGRCVYQMDNDVCDHQVVSALMEDGITIDFQVSGFTAEQDRHIRIMGTTGEIYGDFRDGKVYCRKFRGSLEVFDTTNGKSLSGHGGGDTGLIRDVLTLYRNPDAVLPSVTTIGKSLESHLMAFAAEESRRKGGALLCMDEFRKENGRQ